VQDALARLDRLASWPRVVIVFPAEVILIGCENAMVFPLSVPYLHRLTGTYYLDACAFCSSAQIYGMLDTLGPIGRVLELRMLSTIDVVIPVLSGVFGALTIAFFTKSWRGGLRGALVLVPVLAMMLDYSENVLIAVVTSRYPARLEGLASVLGFVTGLKVSAYAVTVLAVVVTGLVSAYRRAKVQPSDPA
jgi:hypothetical protein